MREGHDLVGRPDPCRRRAVPSAARTKAGWPRGEALDAATQIEGGSTLVYEAAWKRSVGQDTALHAPLAKLFMCHAFRDVTAMCQQVWGGVGFTIEYDIQLYFRRAKQLQLSWYDDRHLGELVAAHELD